MIKLNDTILYILLGIIVFIVFVLLFVIFKLMDQKNKEGQMQMNENLLNFQSNLLQAIHQDMQTLNQNTSTHIHEMEKNVHEQMMHNLKYTNDAYSHVLKEVSKIDEAQKHLQNLSGDIKDLHTIFADKKTRGMYGEVELYTILERSFGEASSFYAKQYKLSNGYMVDAVVFGNDALGMIAIDSKFPLENFNRLQQNDISIQEKKTLSIEFKNNVKKHIRDISEKYIVPEETSVFAYMFIPSEAIFSYINAYYPEVIEYSFENKVYLASPSTLMAYITAMKALYLDQKKNERIKDIQIELHQLATEFERFNKRYEMVIKDFEKCANDMHDVMVSAKKISKRFEKIEQVEL